MGEPPLPRKDAHSDPQVEGLTDTGVAGLFTLAATVHSAFRSVSRVPSPRPFIRLLIPPEFPTDRLESVVGSSIFRLVRLCLQVEAVRALGILPWTAIEHVDLG